MKQKYMRKLLLLLALTLVFSVAVGGVSAEKGFAAQSVTDFRVDLDRTQTVVGQPVNLVVSLLDEQGKVDVFANSSEVVGYYVEVSSLFGEISEYNDFAAMPGGTRSIEIIRGVGATHVDYDHPGTDLLRVSVYAYSGMEESVTLVGYKDFTIAVTGDEAAATALQLDDESDEVNAGEATTLKVLADQDGISGTLTVDIYYGDNCNKETLTGEMVNSVAFVDLPAETLTKAGSYGVVLSVSGVEKSSNDALTVNALEASKVGVVVGTPSYINLDVEGSCAKATIYLYDEYGNVVNAATDTTVAVGATNNVEIYGSAGCSGSSITEVTIGEGSSSVDVYASAGEDDPTTSNGIGSSTLSISSDDLESQGTATITIYEESLTVTVNEDEYDAGETVESAINVSVDGATVTGKRVKVDLYDDSDSLIESVTSTTNDDGNAALRFTKAVDPGYFVVSYISSGQAYGPVKLDDDITVNPADATDLQLYQAAIDYDQCLGTGTPVQELTEINVVEGEDFTISDTVTGTYYGILKDAFGNQADGTIYWESDSDSGQLTKTFSYATAGTYTLTFYSVELGVDPVEVTVNVTAEEDETTPVLTSIELLPSSETMLANGEIPFVVKAYDADGEPYAWDENELTILMDPSHRVMVRPKERFGCNHMAFAQHEGTYSNGDFLSGACGELVLSVVAGSTVGDVTLTVRTTDGTVQDAVVLHVVDSIHDFPGETQIGNPAAPMAPQDFPGTVNPADTPVVVTEGAVSMAPQMSVNCDDVASVVGYIWMPDANAGIDVSAMISQSCEDGVLTLDLGSVDFTGFPGTYDFYFGYVGTDGNIYYNAYRLVVNAL